LTCDNLLETSKDGDLQREEGHAEQAVPHSGRPEEVSRLCEGREQGEDREVRRPEYDDQEEHPFQEEVIPCEAQLLYRY
jgi:hypothetical protein